MDVHRGSGPLGPSGPTGPGPSFSIMSSEPSCR